MANDGVTVHFRGGQKLDRALSRIGNIKQSKATSIIYSSLSAGATQVKKGIIAKAPKWSGGDTEGFKVNSQNTTVGQLRKSIKSGLRKKVNVGRNTFLAGVWFQNKRGGAKDGVDDGFFIKFLEETHKANAFGFTGGQPFIKKGVKNSSQAFKNKVGGSMARKIALWGQSEINKIG